MVILRPAIFGSISTCDIPARSIANFVHELHAKFLMRHFAAAKLQLHPHFIFPDPGILRRAGFSSDNRDRRC